MDRMFSATESSDHFYFINCPGLGSVSEQELIYDLFERPGYNPLIRPVRNISEAINVTMGVTLFQVITVVSIISAHAFTVMFKRRIKKSVLKFDI